MSKNNKSTLLGSDPNEKTLTDISQVKANAKTLNLKKKDIETLARYEKQLKEKAQEDLSSKAKRLLKEQAEYEKKLRSEANLAIISASFASMKAEGDTFFSALSKKAKAISEESAENIKTKVATGLVKGLSDIVDTVDSAMDTYISKQEAIVAHLTGSSDSFSNVADKLSTLLSTGLVKQSAVYDNVSKFVTQGIVSNVEQKAFLQTLADDIDATFDASDGTLIRLINLQKEDLSSNRLAIEYSLQEFLNQNYETSTYIKDAFSTVSNSLIEMQSLMSAQSAIDAETIIQTYLGSLSSSGMSSNTVSSIATAINAVGSGDTSNLGNGISKLILMGAARSGLDYADMLVNGLDNSSIASLLEGISGYLAEINESYSSNVVKSQLAQIYGVNVSDLVAASNYEASNPSGTVTSDIYTALLDNFGDLVPGVVKIQNLLDNFVQGMAIQIASSDAGYFAFKAYNALADTLGDALAGKSVSVKLFGTGVDMDLGAIAKSAKVLSLLPSVIGGIGNLAGAFNVNNWTSASGIYDALLNASSSAQTSSAGFGFTLDTGSSVSNSMTVAGDIDASELVSSAKTSSNDLLKQTNITQDAETLSLSDVIEAIANANNSINSGHNTLMSIGTNLDTYWGITDTDNKAVVSNTSSSNDMLSVIGDATINIYNLLEMKLAEMSTQLDNVVMAIENGTMTISSSVDNAGSSIGGTFWQSI